MIKRRLTLLSVQRALLGEVSFALRGVVVDYEEAKKIIIRCYFDGEISEEDKESMSEVQTSVMADFDLDIDIELEIERLDSPKRPQLSNNWTWVYFRRESAPKGEI
ncbi:hypothetical protein A3J13_00845 [Candidatus Daviesbacteria bacterium RIFCSPLOWO2_02_FULL_36_8]|uniref:Uncharacterized protein n=1 Tax=Candidatus Daviesbacteria bacterium RIFCSPLOWO2_02_FULL_36_8 TaxID=1797793 RepID=A0A1F5MH54_9BACT|nr:MAG: hypothetical protein A3J13_00845 [Candidatus Daviesbacteria bacterium RIFCSPLOWO2_02_FULL_36_8]